ncbi:MAG: peptidyl-prolyl cis-trans isomerase [Planctomycetes bacterium]|nr:peptidyl-prolyl cis-trans isomerase [Planctomycetota bacterium]
MKQLAPVFALMLIALAVSMSGCGNGNTDVPIIEPGPDVKAFREAAVELQKRDELDLDQVTIQYVQLPTMIEGNAESKPRLLAEEAEAKAAELFKQAKAGADFDRLVYMHSYGNLTPAQRPGAFTLLKGELPPNLGPATFQREQQDTSVWKAAWRLRPGEIGAVEKHHQDSPGGYYVIRRLSEEERLKDNPANFDPPNAHVAKYREDAQALSSRPEHNAERVKVQHFVIARYMSAPGGRGEILQPAEAEIKAAELYAQLLDGADFSAIVREYTYDHLDGAPPGVYVMVADDSELEGTKRSGMTRAFGDAAWRLEVGEFGPVLYDPARSFYGYHVIKRLE